MTTWHVQCPNCGAPLTVADIVVILYCEYCGASSPGPEAVKNDPLWIRAMRLREIKQWYERARAELMVTDSSGNLRPPTDACPQAHVVLLACGAAGFALSLPVLLVSLIFPQAFLLIVISFFGPGLGGLLWSHVLRTRTLDRYRKFQELEQEYRARVAALDAS